MDLSEEKGFEERPGWSGSYFRLVMDRLSCLALCNIAIQQCTIYWSFLIVKKSIDWNFSNVMLCSHRQVQSRHYGFRENFSDLDLTSR